MLTLLLLAIGFVSAKIVEYDFVVTENIIYPDGYEWKGALINGNFPGPEIRAHPRDIIVVNLYNKLPRNFTLHFHGLDQKGSNEADGVPFVTQYPVPPNGSYKYKVNVGEQTGTYWYHSHVSLDGITAFGPLIIEDENWNDIVHYNQRYYYDYESTIMLSDIFFNSIETMVANMTSKSFGFADLARSILVNGNTIGEPQNPRINKKAAWDNSTYTVLEVARNKVYRLRFVGATTVNALSCEITDHKMTIVEIDGVLVDPVQTKNLIIHSGQRYSVLLETSKKDGDYFCNCFTVGKAGPANGRFVLSYKGLESANTQVFNKTTPKFGKDDNQWVYNNLTLSSYYNKSPTSRIYKLPHKVDKRFLFNIIPRKFDGTYKFVIENTVFGEEETLFPLVKENSGGTEVYEIQNSTFSSLKYPLIDRIKQEENPNFPGVYHYNEGETVEIVLHMYPIENNICNYHPWHLHGHLFYVVAEGTGRYNESNVKYINNSYMRDTVETGKGTSTGPEEPCGYKVIRFVGNNPGVWLMHCHITHHMFIGMQVAFVEREKRLHNLHNNQTSKRNLTNTRLY